MKLDLNTIKRKLLIKYPFFGHVLARVEYSPNKQISTAGTDGQTIYYNPEYLEKLSLDNQIFILAHEVCHIAFNHLSRSQDKNISLWNIATDGVINQFLKQDGLHLVKGAVDIPDAINYDAETLYEKLLKAEEENNNSSLDISNFVSANNNENIGHDSHELWQDNFIRKESSSESIAISSLGEKEAFHKNQEIKNQELEDLQNTLAKETLSAGSKTSGNEILIDNIGYNKALLDWRYILRETINYNLDWSYQHATIEDGIITPHLEEYPLPETEIILDTSGSINNELLKNFLRECKNIFQTSKLKVGCFDTEFYGFHEIHSEEDLEKMSFVGGGGTDFNVAVNAFTNRVENKIIFTDGYADMPQKPLDAIWIVYGEEDIFPLGGKVIKIDPSNIEKLSLFASDSEVKRIRKYHY